MLIPQDYDISLTISKTKVNYENSLNNAHLFNIKSNEYNNKSNSSNIDNDKKNLIVKNYKSLKHQKKKNKLKSILFNHKIPSLKELQKKAHEKFIHSYIDNDSYNIQKIEEIVNNEKSHLVAQFKDFLVIGDIAEFLLGYYSIDFIKILYPQLLEYYNDNLFIFPNYVILPESKYIYSNIKKKQKIIDIQEEVKDNENMNKEDVKTVFNSKEVESLLNQTQTSAIKQFFGLSINNDNNNNKNNNDKNNNIDKNEQQIIKLIDNINNIEKNQFKNNNNLDNQKIGSVYIKRNNLGKCIKNDNNKNNKNKNNSNHNNSNYNNSNNNSNHNNSNNNNKVFNNSNKNNFKISINNNTNNTNNTNNKNSGNKNDGKNIISQKNLKIKFPNKRNNLSQPELKNLNNLSNKAININNIINNTMKNNFKEKIKKNENKEKEKEIVNYSKRNNKIQIVGNIYNRLKDNKLLKKIINKKNDNNNKLMNKLNPIKINKKLFKEINKYQYDEKNATNCNRSKSYKKLLMRSLFSSRLGKTNNKINNSRNYITKNNLKIRYINNSGIEGPLENNYLSSTINGKEKTIILKNEKNLFKLGRIHNPKAELFNNIKFSSSCKNICISSYTNNKINFNRKNIYDFSNRNNCNCSYKKFTNLSNNKIRLSNDKKLNFRNIDYFLTYETYTKPENSNKKFNSIGSKTLFDSYSTKEMSKKYKKSKDSSKIIINAKKFNNKQKTKIKKKSKEKNDNNKPKILYINKKIKILKNIKNKDPFEYICNIEYPLTERKTKERIELNFEKIDVLSQQVKKFREKLGNSVDKNINSFSKIYDQKSISIKNCKKIENKKPNNKYNNIIKVYLSNKTRNKDIKMNSNNQNLYSIDPCLKIFKFANSFKKGNNEIKNLYQTINTNYNINTSRKISKKYDMDKFYKYKNYTISCYSKKDKIFNK